VRTFASFTGLARTPLACLAVLAGVASVGSRAASATPTRAVASPRGAGARADKAKAKRAQPRNGAVELYAVNGKETLLLRLRDDKGRSLRGVQKRFDHFLRCHNTNIQHPMNPRLVRLMYQIGRHYPGRRVEVVSGYRHPSVAKNPRSPHMQGLACDFRIAGVRNDELRDYLRRGYEKVGVGFYPNSSFVHLDVRKDRSAFWIDYSGPGERAIYSDNPVADLKSGRVNTYKPTKIDKGWVYQPDNAGDEQGGDDEGPPAAGVPRVESAAPGEQHHPPGERTATPAATAAPVAAPTTTASAAPAVSGHIAGTVGKGPPSAGGGEAPR